MMFINTVLALILVVAVLWLGWTLWQNGWDLKKAAAAVVAAAAAWWLWISDSMTHMSGL
jgi:hypothetical protein